MGYINISDGSITPTPPPPRPDDDVENTYAADEQFANVYWQWAYGWHEQRCPAGLVYNIDNNVCDYPQDANNPARYVLDDPSLA